jgi:hydrogenase maturation protease
LKTKEKQDRVLVVGVGNSLRTDDGVGLYLCGLFRERFGELADVLEVYGPDILLSETVSAARRLLVIDAVAEGPPFRIVPLLPQETPWQPGPFTSHLFSWPAILSASRALYGKSPEAELLAVRGYDFGIGFSLTPECKNNADKAFEDKLLFL